MKIKYFILLLILTVLVSCSKDIPLLTNKVPDEKLIETLKKSKKCIKCDLQNSNLNYFKLQNSDLTEATLDASSLNGVKLNNSKLEKTSFVNVCFL